MPDFARDLIADGDHSRVARRSVESAEQDAIHEADVRESHETTDTELYRSQMDIRVPCRSVPQAVDVALAYRLLENRCATFMYMDTTVGIADLRQNLSLYLRRVENGERLLVTDRNRPVAELGPPPSTGRALDRLIAEGRVTRPIRRGLPAPLQMGGDPYALSRALDEIRGEL